MRTAVKYLEEEELDVFILNQILNQILILILNLTRPKVLLDSLLS